VAILLDRVIGKRWSFALSEVTRVSVEALATGEGRYRGRTTLRLSQSPYSIALTTRDANQLTRSLKSVGLSVEET
jgi:hypothetical protein